MVVAYCFTYHVRTFHPYGNVTIVSGRLQNVGLCLVLMVIEQGGNSVYTVSYYGPPFLVTYYDKQGIQRMYSNPDTHGTVHL
jgi:hypothetical protein